MVMTAMLGTAPRHPNRSPSSGLTGGPTLDSGCRSAGVSARLKLCLHAQRRMRVGSPVKPERYGFWAGLKPIRTRQPPAW
jgi:hypothetical protein